MKFIIVIAFISYLGSFSACASIVGSKTTPVTITSVPSGATVEILDRDGMMRFTGQARGVGTDQGVFLQPGMISGRPVRD